MPQSTPHISEPVIPYAKTVLMPGDPLRSKYIAEKYLNNAVLVNNIRGIHGYTGEFNGMPVSIMASGMGMPYMGLYSYELFNFFGVENIIRIGSMGSYHKKIPLRSLVFAMSASTNSNYLSQYNLPGNYAPTADWNLLKKSTETAEFFGLKYYVGNVVSSDIFYNDNHENYKEWAKMGVLGVEMEAASLYANAARLGKKALAILTVSDNVATKEELSAGERQATFDEMALVALNVAAKSI